MRINTARHALLEGRPAFGYQLGLGSPIVAETLASSGIDFVLLDTQHGSFGADSATLSLLAMARSKAVPMARVARNDYALIGRLLDEGAMGIVVPRVGSVEEAEAAASACRFPPAGARSWGWARARSLGDDYPEWIDEQLFVAVQIESVTAVEKAEAMLSIPGIDGCWVDPADLALSMGVPVKEASYHQEHARALERVLEACQNTGKVPGIAESSAEAAVRRSQQGFRFITAGSDVGFIQVGAQAGLRTLSATIGR